MHTDVSIPSNVAIRFEEAAQTLMHLPADKPARYKSAMPLPFLESEPEPLRKKPIFPSCFPDAEQLSRLDEVLNWTMWLNEKEKKLVWARALHTPWKPLCQKMGCSRTAAWRSWTVALIKISNRLTRKNTPLQPSH